MSIIFSQLTCVTFIQINVRHDLRLILRYMMVLRVKNSQSYMGRKVGHLAHAVLLRSSKIQAQPQDLCLKLHSDLVCLGTFGN